MLDRLLPQLSPLVHELLFLDSNSTDGTIDYITGLPFPNIRMLPVETGTFSHSRTRMWGSDNCLSDLVVFFSDDIIPCNNNFLAELVLPVAEGVASASYGVSLIDPENGDPLRAHRYNNWYLRQPEIIEPLTEAEWSDLAPAEKRKRCNFDDCAACYNRKVLQELRFPDLPYGEDIGVAKRFITGGHTVALAKEAKFYHWHNVSFDYFLRRMCIEQIVVNDLFGLLYVKSKVGLLITIALQVALYSVLAFTLPMITFKIRFHWLIYSLRYICADNLGKYIGGLQSESIYGWNIIDVYLLRMKQSIYGDVLFNSIKRN